MVLALLTIVGFQNCGEGFDASGDNEESDFLLSTLTDKQILAGDMVLDTEAIQVKGGDGTKGDGQQAATGLTIYNTKYWSNGVIPVEFELKHRDRNYREKLFFQVCAEWSQNANIKCIKRTNQSNYLLVRDTVAACNTQVGAGKYGGRRTLTFGLDWCWNRKSLLHEIGHVLGLMHEHQRPDRDNYVTIKENYIKAGYEHAYKKFHTADTKSSYDFASVMHYHAFAYSIHPSLAVMLPKPAYNSKFGIMGKYERLSTLDKQIIKKMYPYTPQPTPTPTPTPTPVTYKSCQFDGKTIPHGGKVKAYKARTVTAPDTCRSLTRTCNDGYMNGIWTYKYLSCSVVNPKPTPTPTPMPPAPTTCGAVNISFGQGCTYRSDTKKNVGTHKIPNVTAGYTGSVVATCQPNGLYTFSNWTCTSIKVTPTPTPTPTPKPVQPTPTPTPTPVFGGGGGGGYPIYPYQYQNQTQNQYYY